MIYKVTSIAIMNTLKVIIFSALVNVNILLWYEILGIKFLFVLGLVIAVIVLFLWKK